MEHSIPKSNTPLDATHSRDVKKDKEADLLQDEKVEDIEDSKPRGKVDYSGAYEKTDPKEIALVKKLDRWIMPMLWSMYWLNYLDRNAIALARINTIEEDLNLQGTQYVQKPSNKSSIYLQRF